MITVLIAGIAGASLGTEIAKSLRLAGGYHIIGCDPSPLAFGHYSDLCDKTVRVSLDRYIVSRKEHVQVIVPGAEEPMRLITAAANRFSQGGNSVGDELAGCRDTACGQGTLFHRIATSRNRDSANGCGNRTYNARPGAIPVLD